ncbi:hypothetical protein DSECCO2_335570 [anaerobic digester metagenome]
MIGIDEILLTLALNYTSDEVSKLIKGKETLESDLLRSYNDALKEWSKNDDIRRMTARNFSTHFKQLGEYIKSPSSQIKGTEISKLLNIWESKLRNYDNTYHYLSEKRTEKISEDIEYIRSVVDRINKQFAVKIEQFEPIPDYIPRQISTEIDDNIDFFTPKSTFKLAEIISDKESYPKRKFILYSSAQTGKTTELKHLAYQLQESELFTPIFHNLNNYILSTFYERLKSIVIQYDGVIFLLDGYDEIKDVNKDRFLDELNLFAVDFPNIPILISSRINFEDKSLFQDFQPLYLEPLSYDDIHTYIDKNYTDIRESFIDKASNLGVLGLLQTPFYLKEMLKYFSDYSDLPQTKSELYKILIDESFWIDEKHKPERGYVQQLKTKGYKILQKVAFVMILCEKKELSEYELSEVLTEEEFQIAIHFSIFKRDASKLMYSFEHIAFKEFLMAEFLISISENEVVKLIFYPESNKLIKSWYNIVLLFLELLQDIPEKFQSIIDTLIENDNHVIIDASPKFLSKNNRVEIFKKIYNFYKKKGLDIVYEFKKKLMTFANYSETILFLVEQLKSDGTNANYRNALALLEYADYNELKEKEYVKQTLKDFLSKKHQTKELRNYLFSPFNNEEYANEKDIQEIGKIIQDNKQAEVIDYYFDLLLKLDNVDNYAERIFESQQYINDYEDDLGVHHMVYRYAVYQIYDKLTSIENIANALIYTASEKGYLSRGKEEQIGVKKKLLLKLSDLYRSEPDEQIIEMVLTAFVQEDFSTYGLDQYEIGTALLYKDFFVSIGKVESILNNEYAILEESLSKNTIDHKRELLIPLLMTEDYFVAKMHSYDKTDLAGYYHMKYTLSFNDDLSEKLTEQLEAYFSIPKLKIRDWQKEKQDDFDLILDYQRFKKEIEYHCDTDCKFIYKFRNRDLISDDLISNCVDYFLYEFTKDEKINIEAAREAINDLEKYFKFTLIHISHYMNYGNEETSILANKKQKQVINGLVSQTVNKGVDTDNLETLLAAITFFDFNLTEEQIREFMPLSYRNIPNHIGYKYRLKGNESDDLTFSHNTNLLDFLIYKSSEEFINNQIISIIENENRYNEMLYRALADYIVQNKINWLYKFLPIILFDKLDEEYDKRQVLYDISRIENSYSLIEERFEELSDESKISYFSYLKEGKVPELICETLWEIYQRTDGDVKLKCLSVLLRNGCMKALDEFIIFLEENQYATADEFPRLSYIGEEYLDSLIEILKIILPKVDINYNRFVDVVLYPIEETAVMNNENLEKVTKAFEQIIEKNKDYHFLNRRIMLMTDRFYESGRFNRTIKEALKEFQYLTD